MTKAKIKVNRDKKKEDDPTISDQLGQTMQKDIERWTVRKLERESYSSQAEITHSFNCPVQHRYGREES